MTWIRKNVWELIATPGDQTLHWYGQGVAALQRRSFTEPTSWWFQGAVHGRPGWPDDPAPGSPWAAVDAAVRRTYWDQCQHQTWYFLPWHRMYLGYFERMLRAAIVAAGGPEDWALPYWDYSKSAEQRLLPTPFRNPTLEDGSRNPLYVEARNPLANAGEQILDEEDVRLDALDEASFFVPSDETGTSFAGPQTPSQHFGQAGSGALESAPHNLVHVQVGLPDGWMLDPSLAALDPIFWLHHANIDRLWEVWLQRAGHANTSESAWTSDVTFDFMDEAGTPQRLTPGDVASIASPFDYTYDDLPLRIQEPLPLPEPLPLVAAARRIAVPSRKAALAAATSQPTALSRQRVDVNVPRPALARLGAAAAPTNAPTKIYLSLEGMTADKPAGSYDIYIGVAGQQAPAREQFVARLAPFGIAAASSPKGPHGGAGLSETFDISQAMARLRASGVDVTAGYDVTIVPVKGANDAALQIGRIAIYEG
ncbi:MAG: hypothetical protein RL033_7541 [Pseudomonadota bacterium]